jgi:hypothetical protein
MDRIPLVEVANVRIDILERNVEAMNAVVTNVASTQAVMIYQQAENKRLIETLQTSIDALGSRAADKIDDHRVMQDAQLSVIEKEVERITRWMWLLTGAGTFAGALITLVVSYLDKIFP